MKMIEIIGNFAAGAYTEAMRVILIGAGPGGLALAHLLKKSGVECLILEKAARVGSTFHDMTANTTYGPWINSQLPDGPVPWTRWLRRATREQYAEYLVDYALKHDLPYRTGVTVYSVSPGFELITSQGAFRAPLVVNATGYFSQPYVPAIPGAAESGIPQIHTSQFESPATVRARLGRNRALILVVGGRLSAGETMAALHRAGYQVCLSHGSPIEFFPSAWAEFCMAPVTQLLEEIRVRIPGTSRPWNLNVRMNGDEHKSLIESGRVPVLPEIRRFEEDLVVFQDERRERFDMVIYGTGYRPALSHLSGLITQDPLTHLPPLRGMESAEAPGLFFLGLIGLRTFRSQFLRGLRDDSRELARILLRRIEKGECHNDDQRYHAAQSSQGGAGHAGG